MKDFLEPHQINSIELLEQEVEKVFLLADKGIVKMVISVIIANRMPLDPVWLLLVAPPSSGKSEMIDAISSMDFVFPISDLTVNTFASGQKKTGKETSLLLKMTNGVMAFKDFTSVLSKNKDAKKEIMGQLREIYDGHYVKRTGTGDDIVWTGKVGAIAGCTEVIYRHIEEMSAMGDRFIMYNMIQPDRLEMAKRALSNADSMHEKREHLRKCFTHFANSVIEQIHTGSGVVELDNKMKERILNVADFATRVRSAVLTDFKSGLVDFVPKAEMPTRMTAQLHTLASAFIVINKINPRLAVDHPANKGTLTSDEERLLWKVAFDSIPRTRRDALIPLARFKDGLSTAGLATYLNLPTPSVGKYLAQVNALGVCSRLKKGGKQGDMWKIKEEYRQIILDLEGIEVEEGSLLSDGLDEDDDYEDSMSTLDREWPDEEESLNPKF